jgi:hypothetical protein
LGVRALLNALRFLIAGLLYTLLTYKHQRAFARSEALGGIALGMVFGGGMLSQVLGLAWARPSVSWFLTALAVVFAPLAQSWILRRPVSGIVWVAVVVALGGALSLLQPP